MAYKVLRLKPDLQHLAERLLAEPLLKRKFSLIGVLNNTLQGKLSFEAVVDRWPDYSTLVLRPTEGAPSSQRYRLVDANDPEKMRDFLSVPGVLPWETTFEIRALPSPLDTAMKQVILDNRSTISRRYHQYVFHLDVLPKEHIRLPQGYYLQPLRPEHAQIVFDNWDFAVVEGREAYEYLRYQLDTFTTMAVFSEKHEPASWVVNMFDGSMGMGATVAEARNKGLMGAVVTGNRQYNDNIFTYVPVTLMPSLRLMKTQSATKLTDSILYLRCEPNF